MFTLRRAFLGVFAVTLMLTNSVAAVEESSSSASHQRRELWDFFDFLMMSKGGCGDSRQWATGFDLGWLRHTKAI